MSLISIIIPYYKKKRYIEQTLDSVLKQKHRYLEILIIYDDEDLKDLIFLKRLQRKDKRIRLIINKKNIGVGLSRNKAIKLSKGKYIAFLDSDDLWKKNKLDNQLKFMKKNNYLISHTNYEIINEKNKKVGIMKIDKELGYKNLIYSCDIGLSTVMVNSKIKNMIRFPKLKTKEDYVLWLKLSRKYKIYGLQKNLVFWRKNKNPFSYTIQKIKDAFIVYSKFEKFNKVKTLLHVFLLSTNFIKKIFSQRI